MPALRSIPLLLLLTLAVTMTAASVAQAAPASLRVMHWNVRGYHRLVTVPPRPDGSRGPVTQLSLGRFSTARAAAVVANQSPDVVGFDELCRGQLKAIRARLKRRGYLYSRHVSDDSRTRCRLGVGMLSRLPIVGERTIRLTNVSLAGTTIPGRTYMKGIEVMVGARPVWVFEWHSRDVAQSVDATWRLQVGPDTSVGMCDCNRYPWSMPFMVSALFFTAQAGFAEVDLSEWPRWPSVPMPSVADPQGRPTYGNYEVATDANGAPYIRHRPPIRKKGYIFVRGPVGTAVDGVNTPPSWLSDHVPMLADIHLP